MSIKEGIQIFYLNIRMPNSQQQQISEQSEDPQLKFASIQDQVQPSDSQRPNLLDQGFIIYSDDEIQSNSQSCKSSVSHSDLSQLSRQSSCSSIENYEMNSQSGHSKSFLKSLAHGNEQSSIYNIHESECSQSGIELLHALEPLFNGKLFLKGSERVAAYGTGEDELMKSQKKTTVLSNINVQDINKKQLESEMVEDDRAALNISSTRIIEEKYETPTSIFTNNIASQNTNSSNQQSTKQQSPNPFVRFTRSSKKIMDQPEITYGSVIKGDNLNIFNPENEIINDNQYLSRLTKDYILLNRKEKRIKKHQQKQTHSIRGLRKKQNSYQYTPN